MKKSGILLILLSTSLILFSQDQDSLLIKRIFDEALSSRIAYENLRYLCKNTKGRISGTTQAEAAIEYTRQVMLDMGLDTVFLQELYGKKMGKG